MPSISLSSHFLADHLTLHSLANCFCIDHLTLYLSIPWASYFNSLSAGKLFSCRPFNCHPSIPLASYFCVVHPFGKLFLCRPFNCPSLWRVIFVSSIPWTSYFCVVHSLGELFSCRAFNSPSSGELFSCLPCNSPPVHPFSELFLCRLSLGRVIFVPTVHYLHPSVHLASYFSRLFK